MSDELVGAHDDHDTRDFSKSAWEAASLETRDMPIQINGKETWVTIRELTASEVAKITDQALTVRPGRGAKLNQELRAALTFSAGVIRPKWDTAEAMALSQRIGEPFNVVVAAIDDLSGSGPEMTTALDAAKARFQPGTAKP